MWRDRRIAPTRYSELGNVAKTSGSYQAPGDITIEQGASIVTHTNGTVSDGGFVLVAAPNVTNGGSITATDGKVVLAAGVGVSLRPNSGLKNNPQLLLPELSGQIVTTQNGTTVDLTPVGTLTNTGIVQASRGSVNLLGGRVAENGVVGVTTSVNTPGRITISTADEYASNDPLGNAYPGTTLVTGGVDADNAKRSGLLTFGPKPVTTVLPDNSGRTATSTPGTTFTPGGIAMTAGAVWFQGGSLIEAPGSNVSVAALSPSVTAYTPDVKQSSAPGRIYQDAGSTIDVSGLANVEIPIAQTLVTVDQNRPERTGRFAAAARQFPRGAEERRRGQHADGYAQRWRVVGRQPDPESVGVCEPDSAQCRSVADQRWDDHAVG